MKAKLFSIFLTFILFSTMYLPTGFTQDSTKWGLPGGAEARLGKGVISAIAYSPSGSRLAVASRTGIWIYDAVTGEERSLLGAHTGMITSIAYSRDGKMLASAHNVHGYIKNREFYVALWDATTGTLIKTLSHKSDRNISPINSVAFSPDGTRIAMGDNQGGLLWNVVTGTLIGTLAGKRVESVTFSPDGRTIAGGHNLVHDSAPLTLWDGATGAFKEALHPTERLIMDVAYSPDGTILACATTDGRVILWDVAAGLPIDTFVVFDGNTPNVVAYSPDGKSIAVGAARKVSIWDAATSRRRHFLSGHIESIRSIAYSPDNRTVASGSDDGTVRFWNASTGALRHTITGHTNKVNAVAYSPDGNTLAIGGAYSVNTVGLWDVATSTLKNSLEIDTTGFGWSYVVSLAFSPDSSTIAGGNYQETYLWDVATHKIIRRLEWSYRSRGITYSPDGSAIAGGISSRTAALSPDGTKLVTPGGGLSGDTMASLWDVATGALIKSFTLSSNASGDALLVWDVATRRIIDKLTQASEDRYVHGLAYSPDGNTIAAASGASVYLWDAGATRLRYRLTEDTHDGHDYDVRSVTFSPDSTTLASGGGFYDRTVRLWDVRTGTLKNILHGHSGAVESLVFSPDGTTLASGSHDGTVLLWGLTPSVPTPAMAPEFTEGSSATRAIAENTQLGVNIGTPVAATDADNDTPTYTLSGTDANAFSIDTTTGQLRTRAALDHETKSVYTVIITASDGKLTDSVTVTINITDIDEPELVTTPSTSDNTYNAQDKLTGPWLWMIAPTAAGQGGALATNVDSLAAASGGAVTEADVAANGANEGDKVGALEWTLGEISATGGNNINDLVEEIGFGEGDINDHSSYALITLESDTAQSGVTMRVGSDNSIKVWLNGEVVHIKAVNRSAGDFQDTFKVNLKKGDNLLLVKVSERGGGWSMFVGLDVNVTYKVPTRDVAPVPADDAYPAWDVNEDGQTSIADLIAVLAAFEKTPIVNPRTDVNGDGTVDKQDIIIVATHLGESTTPAAPISVALPERLTPEMLQQALDLLRAHNDGSLAFQRGIARLEQLLALLIPKETALLANYPNPFNPETWIPYELAEPADVSVRIYSVNGSLVRRLSLGHQAAGMYRSRSRSAYWDGKNELGESVASGVYFYTLTAEDFTATRKMLIRK